MIENSIENGSIVSDAFVPTSSLCCSKKINNNCDTNEDVFRLSLVSKSKELDPEIYGGAFLKHVKELLEYKQEYGHLLVPKRYRENPTLGNWVNKTRQQYKHYLNNKPSSMTQERIDLLDKIGFVWSATHNLDDDSLPQIYRQTEISQSWWESYNELTDFVSRQQKESNSNKKIKYPQTSTTLGQWLTSQRRQYQSNKPKTGDRSNNERWDLLFDLLGPDWYKSPRQTKWDQRIKELKEFKQQHGHCMVSEATWIYKIIVITKKVIKLILEKFLSCASSKITILFLICNH